MLLLSDIFVDKKDYFNARAVLEGLLDGYKEDADITRQAQTKLDNVKRLQASGNKLRPDTLKVNSFFDNN